ncbi:MAG: hypothetical protein IJU40_08810 [Desulfovibrionaceae bacterium]|nr:hypothetical protein [Desulfovibrionaceae bacterium]
MKHTEIVRRYGSRGKGYRNPHNIVIRTIKAFHLLSATAWAGGALAMQALSFLKFTTDNSAAIPFIQQCSYFVDTWVVIPGLCGSALTGLFYSIFTSIGFFKYFWITFKWFITCCAGFWGILFWTSYGDALIEYLTPLKWDWPLRVIRSFILPESMFQGFLQLSVIFTMCLIAVYRPLRFPWNRKKKKDSL